MKKFLLLLTILAHSVCADSFTFTAERLIDKKPTVVSEKDFSGQFLLFAVGYTSCPDICPTTLLDYKTALKELDNNKDVLEKLQLMFLTIDPETDTLENITKYVEYFDSRIIGLRAHDYETLNTIVEQLGASYGYEFDSKPVVGGNLPSGYTVSHSTLLYLISPTGEIVDAFPYDTNGTMLAQKITQHIAP